MKKIIRYIYLVLLICASLPGFSQKYKNIEDTVKLNKEYVKLSNDLAALNAKLIVAQNDLPGYKSKAKNANDDASASAAASSDQASKLQTEALKMLRRQKRALIKPIMKRKILNRQTVE